ncbi:protein serine/threonine phosphatase 2C [Dentipellis sp. KUC8613]|nr:protein serine/threonine phosphatase 2C [Dentipellis sp. KUC8613]
MFRRTWKPIAATAVFIGAPAYLYHRYSTNKLKNQSFNLSVREQGPDGQPTMVTRSFPLQSKEQVESRIREFATSETAATSEGLSWKYTTARLSSNDPIEDANAQAVVTQKATPLSPAGNLMFFAVMDGHGGWQTSQLLSKVLIPAVALELSALKDASTTVPHKSSGILSSVKSLLSSKSEASTPVQADSSQITQAIQRAFSNLDAEIVNAPLRFLAANIANTQIAKGLVPDLSQHPMAMASMLPAMSGSCAILGLIDTAHRDLYVACTGDSRAVAGVWEETDDGKGRWHVEVLSEDQTGRNPNELKRMQSEHPAEEANDVIRRGRVLGGLEPTRAFGDARYKWPREVQAVLNEAFLVGNGRSMRTIPSLLKTPPYVTATPVVTHRKLSIPGSELGSEAQPKSKFRFLVLATDGLWDQLSSEEVVSLVGGHLQGLKGNVTKSDLPSLVPVAEGSKTVEGKEKRDKADGGSWSFVDDNLSAHLIRNAFGGGDESKLRRLLSIPSPHSRRYRDDVTVTVVWWEESTSVKAKL